jgi:hypothetical protein
MGRRRKHDRRLRSGFRSDPRAEPKQHHVSGLVTLCCITTRPFAVIHVETLPQSLTKSKQVVHFRLGRDGLF